MCPENSPRIFENCQSMEIWIPELFKDNKNEFVLLLNDSRAKNFNTADGSGIKVGFTVTTGTLPFN